MMSLLLNALDFNPRSRPQLRTPIRFKLANLVYPPGRLLLRLLLSKRHHLQSSSGPTSLSLETTNQLNTTRTTPNLNDTGPSSWSVFWFAFDSAAGGPFRAQELPDQPLLCWENPTVNSISF